MANKIILVKQIIKDLMQKATSLINSLINKIKHLSTNWKYTPRQIGITSIIIIVSLFLLRLVFTRRISTYNFVQTLPGTEKITSLNKTNDQMELSGLLLKTKTARFTLDNAQNLSNINVKFAFKPGQKEIKFGVRGKESDPFIYKSLFFDPLNSLSWNKVEQDGIVLYQKNKQFDTVAAFLSQLSPDKRVGVYQVDTNVLTPYIFPKLSKNSTVIKAPIRGNVTAYILSTGGDIKVKVTKQDMNMYEGADVLNMSLSLTNVKIEEMQIPDDGFTDKSKSQAAPQVYSLNLNNAKPGVYRLDLKFDSPSNDSVITGIEVNQSKIVFGGSILVWNNTATTIYTPAAKINSSTTWTDSIQNLKVDDKADLAVKDTKTKFVFDLIKTIKDKTPGELYKVTAPKGNINLGTNGYFSFSADSYFDTNIIKAQNLTVANSQADLEKNLDYILTTQTPVKEENYWLISELNLKATDYQLKGNKIFFSLEVPDIDKQGGSLEVGGLTVSLISK